MAVGCEPVAMIPGRFLGAYACWLWAPGTTSGFLHAQVRLGTPLPLFAPNPLVLVG